MTDDDNRGPKERIYDDEIAGHMSAIIATCKRVGISMLATFELDPVEEDGGMPLCCATRLPLPEFAVDRHREAARLIGPQSSSCTFVETAETAADGTKRIAIRRVM